MAKLLKCERVAYLLMAAGLYQFKGSHGPTTVHPHQEIDCCGHETLWVWITNNDGCISFNAFPGEEVEDFWLRLSDFLQQFRKKLMFLNFYLDSSLRQVYSPLSPEHDGQVGNTTKFLQLTATDGRSGRIMLDPVIHSTTPNERARRRLKAVAEKAGMKDVRINIQELLAKD